VGDPIRVLVVDDQAVVRERLMTLLQLAAGIEPVAEIARAIQAAAAQQALLDPAAQSRLLAAATAATTATAPPTRAAELPDELTPREAEVLRLIARGISNAEIAAALVVSEATVKRNQPPVRKNRRA
jgi:DNA-binding NarL/FixJ family response regulator